MNYCSGINLSINIFLKYLISSNNIFNTMVVKYNDSSLPASRRFWYLCIQLQDILLTISHVIRLILCYQNVLKCTPEKRSTNWAFVIATTGRWFYNQNISWLCCSEIKRIQNRILLNKSIFETNIKQFG